MASEEHLARLREGVAAWNQWRTANPDITPNLTRVNLTRADLSGADFSEADIRGAKFTGAILPEAKFIGARAGVPKRWMALRVCISFVLCILLDFVGILFAVVFTAFLLNPDFPQGTSIFQHIEMLLIQGVVYLTLACRGFTARALTTISIFVAFVLAGAIASVLVGAVALAIPIAGADAVGIVGSAFAAGVLAVAFAGALALALTLALTVAGAVTSASVFALAFALADALAFAFAPAFAPAYDMARGVVGAGNSDVALANALTDARVIALGVALAALLLSLYVAWQSSKEEDEKFEPARSLGLWLGVLGGTSFKAADLSDADFSGATLIHCDFSRAIVARTRFKDANNSSGPD